MANDTPQGPVIVNGPDYTENLNAIQTGLGDLLDGVTAVSKKGNETAYKNLPKDIQEVLNNLAKIDDTVAKGLNDINTRAQQTISNEEKEEGKKSDKKPDADKLVRLPENVAMPALFIGNKLDILFGEKSAIVTSLGHISSLIENIGLPKAVDSKSLATAKEEKGAKPVKGDSSIGPAVEDLSDAVGSLEDISKAKINPVKALANIEIAAALTKMLSKGMFVVEDDKAKSLKESGKAFSAIANMVDQVSGIAINSLKAVAIYPLARKAIKSAKGFVKETLDTFSDVGQSKEKAKNVQNADKVLTSLDHMIGLIPGIVGKALLVQPMLALLKEKAFNKLSEFFDNMSKVAEHAEKTKPTSILKMVGSLALMNVALPLIVTAATMTVIAGPISAVAAGAMLSITSFFIAYAELVTVVQGMGASLIKNTAILLAVGALMTLAMGSILLATTAATLAGPMALTGLLALIPITAFIAASAVLGYGAMYAIPFLGCLSIASVLLLIGMASLNKAMDSTMNIMKKIKQMSDPDADSKGTAKSANNIPGGNLLAAAGKFLSIGLIILGSGIVGAIAGFAAITLPGLLIYTMIAVPAFSQLTQAMNDIGNALEAARGVVTGEGRNSGLSGLLGNLPGALGDIGGIVGGIVDFLAAFTSIIALIVLSAVVGLVADLAIIPLTGLSKASQLMSSGFTALAQAVPLVGDALAAANAALASASEGQDFKSRGVAGSVAAFFLGDKADALGAFMGLAEVIGAAALIGGAIDDSTIAKFNNLAKAGPAIQAGFGPIKTAMEAVKAATEVDVGDVDHLQEVTDSLADIKLSTEFSSTTNTIADGLDRLGNALHGIQKDDISRLKELKSALAQLTGTTTTSASDTSAGTPMSVDSVEPDNNRVPTLIETLTTAVNSIDSSISGLAAVLGQIKDTVTEIGTDSKSWHSEGANV